MKIASKQDFLDSPDGKEESVDKFGLSDVFVFCKQQLVAVVDEIGFHDFFGEDYEVMGRLRLVLSNQKSESALWGLVFLDLWYCSNLRGKHWDELVLHDSRNIRAVILVAYWVLMVSGADGAALLAAIVNQHNCWDVAEECIAQRGDIGLRAWWSQSVLPQRTCSTT